MNRSLPLVFRLNPSAPTWAQYSDLRVDSGWVRLCGSSSREALDEAVEFAKAGGWR